MRLGLVLREGDEAHMARLAEAHGLFGVMAGDGDPRTAITAAVFASTSTEFVRVVTRVRLGLEHPVTIAEELSILDNVNNGRTVVLADTGELGAGDAGDELAVLREALGNRPIRHDGPRWKVPAGLPANATAPKAIAVTPKPVQLEIPFWLTGESAVDLSRQTGLPVLAQDVSAATSLGSVQPAIAPITGSLEQDRPVVTAWADSGATHLLLALPNDARESAVMTMISRYLVPEVAMPHFPRVMSDSKVPLPWPGDGAYIASKADE